MSSTEEEFESEEEIEEVEEEPKKTKQEVKAVSGKKPRKPLDAEAKKRMLENLEKGRKKAHELRRQKGEAIRKEKANIK